MANRPNPAAACGESELAGTVQSMRPMVPAKDFATSRRFYEDLGFRAQDLSEGLVEFHMGAWSFILQDYYVPQWAENFVFHVRVSNARLWWDRIVALHLVERYGIKACAPHPESWGLVVDLIDPSGVLWRLAGPPISSSE